MGLVGRIEDDNVEGVAGKLAAAYLEMGLGALRHELYGIIRTGEEGNEQVRLSVEHVSDLFLRRTAVPVEVLLEDGRCNAGDEPFPFGELPEVEKEDFSPDVILAEECEDGILADIEGSIFDIDESHGRRKLGKGNDPGRFGARIFLEAPSPHEVFN